MKVCGAGWIVPLVFPDQFNYYIKDRIFWIKLTTYNIFLTGMNLNFTKAEV
jgi:hypothetical protein